MGHTSVIVFSIIYLFLPNGIYYGVETRLLPFKKAKENATLQPTDIIIVNGMQYTIPDFLQMLQLTRYPPYIFSEGSKYTIQEYLKKSPPSAIQLTAYGKLLDLNDVSRLLRGARIVHIRPATFMVEGQRYTLQDLIKNFGQDLQGNIRSSYENGVEEIYYNEKLINPRHLMKLIFDKPKDGEVVIEDFYRTLGEIEDLDVVLQLGGKSFLVRDFLQAYPNGFEGNVRIFYDDREIGFDELSKMVADAKTLNYPKVQNGRDNFDNQDSAISDNQNLALADDQKLALSDDKNSAPAGNQNSASFGNGGFGNNQAMDNFVDQNSASFGNGGSGNNQAIDNFDDQNAVTIGNNQAVDDFDGQNSGSFGNNQAVDNFNDQNSASFGNGGSGNNQAIDDQNSETIGNNQAVGNFDDQNSASIGNDGFGNNQATDDKFRDSKKYNLDNYGDIPVPRTSQRDFRINYDHRYYPSPTYSPDASYEIIIDQSDQPKREDVFEVGNSNSATDVNNEMYPQTSGKVPKRVFEVGNSNSVTYVNDEKFPQNSGKIKQNRLNAFEARNSISGTTEIFPQTSGEVKQNRLNPFEARNFNSGTTEIFPQTSGEVKENRLNPFEAKNFNSGTNEIFPQTSRTVEQNRLNGFEVRNSNSGVNEKFPQTSRVVKQNRLNPFEARNFNSGTNEKFPQTSRTVEQNRLNSFEARNSNSGTNEKFPQTPREVKQNRLNAFEVTNSNSGTNDKFPQTSRMVEQNRLNGFEVRNSNSDTNEKILQTSGKVKQNRLNPFEARNSNSGTNEKFPQTSGKVKQNRLNPFEARNSNSGTNEKFLQTSGKVKQNRLNPFEARNSNSDTNEKFLQTSGKVKQNRLNPFEARNSNSGTNEKFPQTSRAVEQNRLNGFEVRNSNSGANEKFPQTPREVKQNRLNAFEVTNSNSDTNENFPQTSRTVEQNRLNGFEVRNSNSGANEKFPQTSRDVKQNRLNPFEARNSYSGTNEKFPQTSREVKQNRLNPFEARNSNSGTNEKFPQTSRTVEQNRLPREFGDIREPKLQASSSNPNYSVFRRNQRPTTPTITKSDPVFKESKDSPKTVVLTEEILSQLIRNGKTYTPEDILKALSLENSPDVKIRHHSKEYSPVEYLKEFGEDFPCDFSIYKNNELVKMAEIPKIVDLESFRKTSGDDVADLLRTLQKNFKDYIAIFYRNKVYTVENFLQSFKRRLPKNFQILINGMVVGPENIGKYINLSTGNLLENDLDENFPPIYNEGEIYSPLDILILLVRSQDIRVKILYENQYYAPKDYLNNFNRDFVPKNFEIVYDGNIIKPFDITTYIHLVLKKVFPEIYFRGMTLRPADVVYNLAMQDFVPVDVLYEGRLYKPKDFVFIFNPIPEDFVIVAGGIRLEPEYVVRNLLILPDAEVNVNLRQLLEYVKSGSINGRNVPEQYLLTLLETLDTESVVDLLSQYNNLRLEILFEDQKFTLDEIRNKFINLRYPNGFMAVFNGMVMPLRNVFNYLNLRTGRVDILKSLLRINDPKLKVQYGQTLYNIKDFLTKFPNQGFTDLLIIYDGKILAPEEVYKFIIDYYGRNETAQREGFAAPGKDVDDNYTKQALDPSGNNREVNPEQSEPQGQPNRASLRRNLEVTKRQNPSFAIWYILPKINDPNLKVVYRQEMYDVEEFLEKFGYVENADIKIFYRNRFLTLKQASEVFKNGAPDDYRQPDSSSNLQGIWNILLKINDPNLEVVYRHGLYGVQEFLDKFGYVENADIKIFYRDRFLTLEQALEVFKNEAPDNREELTPSKLDSSSDLQGIWNIILKINDPNLEVLYRQGFYGVQEFLDKFGYVENSDIKIFYRNQFLTLKQALEVFKNGAPDDNRHPDSSSNLQGIWNILLKINDPNLEVVYRHGLYGVQEFLDKFGYVVNADIKIFYRNRFLTPKQALEVFKNGAPDNGEELTPSKFDSNLQGIWNILLQINDPNLEVVYRQGFYGVQEFLDKFGYVENSDIKIFYRNRFLTLAQALEVFKNEATDNREELTPSKFDGIWNILLKINDPNLEVVYNQGFYGVQEFLDKFGYVANANIKIFYRNRFLTLAHAFEVFKNGAPDDYRRKERTPSKFDSSSNLQGLWNILLKTNDPTLKVVYRQEPYDVQDFLEKFGYDENADIQIFYRNRYLTPKQALEVFDAEPKSEKQQNAEISKIYSKPALIKLLATIESNFQISSNGKQYQPKHFAEVYRPGMDFQIFLNDKSISQRNLYKLLSSKNNFEEPILIRNVFCNPMTVLMKIVQHFNNKSLDFVIYHNGYTYNPEEFFADFDGKIPNNTQFLVSNKIVPFNQLINMAQIDADVAKILSNVTYVGTDLVKRIKSDTNLRIAYKNQSYTLPSFIAKYGLYQNLNVQIEFGGKILNLDEILTNLKLVTTFSEVINAIPFSLDELQEESHRLEIEYQNDRYSLEEFLKLHANNTDFEIIYQNQKLSLADVIFLLEKGVNNVPKETLYADDAEAEPIIRYIIKRNTANVYFYYQGTKYTPYMFNLTFGDDIPTGVVIFINNHVAETNEVMELLQSTDYSIPEKILIQNISFETHIILHKILMLLSELNLEGVEIVYEKENYTPLNFYETFKADIPKNITILINNQTLTFGNIVRILGIDEIVIKIISSIDRIGTSMLSKLVDKSEVVINYLDNKYPIQEFISKFGNEFNGKFFTNNETTNLYSLIKLFQLTSDFNELINGINDVEITVAQDLGVLNPEGINMSVGEVNYTPKKFVEEFQTDIPKDYRITLWGTDVTIPDVIFLYNLDLSDDHLRKTENAQFPKTPSRKLVNADEIFFIKLLKWHPSNIFVKFEGTLLKPLQYYKINGFLNLHKLKYLVDGKVLQKEDITRMFNNPNADIHPTENTFLIKLLQRRPKNVYVIYDGAQLTLAQYYMIYGDSNVDTMQFLVDGKKLGKEEIIRLYKLDVDHQKIYPIIKHGDHIFNPSDLIMILLQHNPTQVMILHSEEIYSPEQFIALQHGYIPLDLEFIENGTVIPAVEIEKRFDLPEFREENTYWPEIVINGKVYTREDFVKILASLESDCIKIKFAGAIYTPSQFHAQYGGDVPENFEVQIFGLVPNHRLVVELVFDAIKNQESSIGGGTEQIERPDEIKDNNNIGTISASESGNGRKEKLDTISAEIGNKRKVILFDNSQSESKNIIPENLKQKQFNDEDQLLIPLDRITRKSSPLDVDQSSISSQRRKFIDPNFGENEMLPPDLVQSSFNQDKFMRHILPENLRLRQQVNYEDQLSIPLYKLTRKDIPVDVDQSSISSQRRKIIDPNFGENEMLPPDLLQSSFKRHIIPENLKWRQQVNDEEHDKLTRKSIPVDVDQSSISSQRRKIIDPNFGENEMLPPDLLQSSFKQDKFMRHILPENLRLRQQVNYEDQLSIPLYKLTRKDIPVDVDQSSISSQRRKIIDPNFGENEMLPSDLQQDKFMRHAIPIAGSQQSWQRTLPIRGDNLRKYGSDSEIPNYMGMPPYEPQRPQFEREEYSRKSLLPSRRPQREADVI